MKTAIMTDTNSGMTVAAGRDAGVYVLPMPVLIDGNGYLEGVDVTNRQLYDAMAMDRDISSSQPSPGDVMAMWDAILSDGYDEVVYIPMSSGLSGSCHNAAQLALDYGSKVWVVDNHRISVTLLEAVFDAKALADRGQSGRQIKAYLEEKSLQASIYITVNSLKYLKRSGRITASAAAIASMLQIKPVLTIQGEKLDLFAKVRGIRQSEKRMIEAVRADIEARFSDIPRSRLKVATAGTFEKEADAERWRQLVQSAFPQYAVGYYPLSCSIACHVGMDAVAMGVMEIAERDS